MAYCCPCGTSVGIADDTPVQVLVARTQLGDHLELQDFIDDDYSEKRCCDLPDHVLDAFPEGCSVDKLRALELENPEDCQEERARRKEKLKEEHLEKTANILEDLKKQETRVETTVGDFIKRLLALLEQLLKDGITYITLAIAKFLGKVVAWMNPLPETEPIGILPDLNGASGKGATGPVEGLKQATFVNYGKTVKNKPRYTFFPVYINQIRR